MTIKTGSWIQSWSPGDMKAKLFLYIVNEGKHPGKTRPRIIIATKK